MVRSREVKRLPGIHSSRMVVSILDPPEMEVVIYLVIRENGTQRRMLLDRLTQMGL